MTEKWAKKIGFGLLIWGMLMTVSGTADAQMASAIGNMSGGAWQAVTGVATGDFSAAADGAKQTGYGILKGAQTFGNADVPIFGSLTGHFGDRVAAGAIRATGDAGARYVAAQEGISQENLSKVSAATGGGFLGTGIGSRNAIAYEVTNSDGSKTKVLMDANLNATSGTMEGCMPIPVKLDQMKNCIFCPLFLMLYNTSKSMAVSSFDILAQGFRTLMLIGFALYIAYLTLRQVSAFTKQDAPKYITEVLTITFKVVFAWLVLTNGAELYRLALEPLLSAGIEFGGTFLTHQGGYDVKNSDGSVKNRVMTASVDVTQCYSGSPVSGTTTKFYSDSLYVKVDCFLKAVTQEIAVSQSIGSSLMCVARNKASGVVMWDLTMMTTGFIMWCFAWLICLSFAFYLIDSIIRLGILGAITPFLVAAWPFKITQSYTATGWKMFMNAFFTFVFLGLVVSVNVELAAQAATGGSGDASGVQAIMDLINADDVDKLLETMSIGLSGLIFMLLCCVFGFKLCAEAAALAGDMGTTGGSGIGAKIGSAAAGAAKGAATTGAKVLGKGAMFAGEAIPTTGISEKYFGDSKAVSLSDDVRHLGEAVTVGLPKRARNIISRMTPGGRMSSAENSETNREHNRFVEDENQSTEEENNRRQPQPQSRTEENQDRRRDDETRTRENDISTESAQPSGTQPQPSPQDISSQSTGGADEVAAAEAAEAAPRESANDQTRSQLSSETSRAKDELAETARQEAEHASMAPQGGSEVSSHTAHAGGAGNTGNDKKDNGNNKDREAQARDELDASKLTIAQLQGEIEQLRKDLQKFQSVQNVGGGSGDMAERLRKLEEEMRRRGINL